MDYAEWSSHGLVLSRFVGATAWWLADWWNYADWTHGQRARVVESPDWQGPSYKTCCNLASVGRAFQTSRRRELCSFGHHEALAALSPATADRWLSWCEEPTKEDEPKPIKTRAELRRELAKELKLTEVEEHDPPPDDAPDDDAPDDAPDDADARQAAEDTATLLVEHPTLQARVHAVLTNPNSANVFLRRLLETMAAESQL
jgi:hypothetical protein